MTLNTNNSGLTYGGEIKDFPIEIVEKMLERQIDAVNKKSISVFETNRCASSFVGGFDWNKTIEGYDFWDEVVGSKNFNWFFEKYPKKQKISDGQMKQGIKETTGKLDYELDWEFITDMAKRMSENKHKYGKYNWKKPIDKEQLKQALFRHVLAIMEGKTDENHYAAISCNAMMLQYQEKLQSENK